MKNLDELNVTNLGLKEQLLVNGGTDNCPAKKGKSISYYIGYAIGWLFD